MGSNSFSQAAGVQPKSLKMGSAFPKPGTVHELRINSLEHRVCEYVSKWGGGRGTTMIAFLLA